MRLLIAVSRVPTGQGKVRRQTEKGQKDDRHYVVSYDAGKASPTPFRLPALYPHPAALPAIVQPFWLLKLLV